MLTLMLCEVQIYAQRVQFSRQRLAYSFLQAPGTISWECAAPCSGRLSLQLCPEVQQSSVQHTLPMTHSALANRASGSYPPEQQQQPMHGPRAADFCRFPGAGPLSQPHLHPDHSQAADS